MLHTEKDGLDVNLGWPPLILSDKPDPCKTFSGGEWTYPATA